MPRLEIRVELPGNAAVYVPAPFRVDDPVRLGEFLGRYSFATLVTVGEEGLQASHVPVLFRPGGEGLGTLVSHVARANPQARQLGAGGEVLTMFTGPHAYVSPTWYRTAPAVPTWNYAAVHVYGKARLVTDPAAAWELLRATVAVYEAGRDQPWEGDLPVDYRERMMQGLVAFEIGITRWEGKFKLGQNRSAEDVQGVYDGLLRAGDADSRGLAAFMVAAGVVNGSRE